MNFLHRIGDFNKKVDSFHRFFEKNPLNKLDTKERKITKAALPCLDYYTSDLQKNHYPNIQKALSHSYVLPGLSSIVTNTFGFCARSLVYLIRCIAIAILKCAPSSWISPKSSMLAQAGIELYITPHAKPSLIGKNLVNIPRGALLAVPFIGHFLARIYDFAVEKIHRLCIRWKCLSEPSRKIKDNKKLICKYLCDKSKNTLLSKKEKNLLDKLLKGEKLDQMNRRAVNRLAKEIKSTTPYQSPPK